MATARSSMNTTRKRGKRGASSNAKTVAMRRRWRCLVLTAFFFFQAEDGIRDGHVTGVQTCALPIFNAEDIASVVARWTGIPVSRMLESEAVKLTRMEEELEKRIVGQKEAVKKISDTRSEERRVGKECRSGWGPEHEKKRKEGESMRL